LSPRSRAVCCGQISLSPFSLAPSCLRPAASFNFVKLLIPEKPRILSPQLDRKLFNLRQVKLANQALIGRPKLTIKLFTETTRVSTRQLLEYALLEQLFQLSNPQPKAFHSLQKLARVSDQGILNRDLKLCNQCRIFKVNGRLRKHNFEVLAPSYQRRELAPMLSPPTPL
jgi:hypothetical protein